MVRPGIHVHAGKGVYHPRYGRLPRARLRSHRLFRSRYRRPAVLDRPAHGIGRPSTHATAAIARSDASDSSGCGPTGRANTAGAKPQLMRRLRRTKIVATLGPASSDRRAIASLFEAGADVFRINMSHTTHARMRELVAAIREVETEHGRPIGILLDLQGPKLRLGSFATNSATVAKGETFTLDDDATSGDAKRVHLPHPEIFAAIEPGHALLLDDGKVRLVAIGGKLSDRKGVSLPDTTVPFSALTEKDRSDLEAGLDAGVDWVALSFI